MTFLSIYISILIVNRSLFEMRKLLRGKLCASEWVLLARQTKKMGWHQKQISNWIFYHITAKNNWTLCINEKKMLNWICDNQKRIKSLSPTLPCQIYIKLWLIVALERIMTFTFYALLNFFQVTARAFPYEKCATVAWKKWWCCW